MNLIRILLSLLFTFLFVLWSYAQKKLVTIQEAETRFLKSNLLALASQFNIDASKAQVIQAKAFPNPVFSADFNLLDPENNRFLHIGKSGQKGFGLEQIILLGGKRKTQIEIASKNQALAESELSDLLRNLRFQVQSSFYSLYQQQTVLDGYSNQLQLLDTLISFYDKQAQKGNVAMKEVVRLRSVFMRISSNRSAYLQDKIETLKTLQLLLQDSTEIVPVVDREYFNQLVVKPIPTDLEQLAKTNRPDLMAAKQSNELAGLNLKLQKQLAVPDVTVNSTYDQRGGAFRNQVNLGFGIPLPVWNMNKGNISAAKSMTQAQSALQDQKELEVRLDVQAAVADLVRGSFEFEKARKLYNDDFELVFQGINENFQKRNISLLEFVDFFEAYNESKTDFERIRSELAIAAAKVNYVTATQIY